MEVSIHIHTKLILLALALVLSASIATRAAGTVTGSPFGVAYGEGSSNLDHFMDYIHDLGLVRTKVSFYWDKLEPQPGMYDFSALDQYLSQLKPDDQGLLNIFTSGWCTQAQGPCKGSPLTDCPYNDSSCGTSCAERYREFMLAVAQHVKDVAHGGIKYWQRDTEPASPFPHYPADAPEEYVEMQRIFYQAVKSVFPDAIVIGGNHNGSITRSGKPTNAGFFDYFLRNAGNYFDMLDVRLYEDIYTIPARVAWFKEQMHMYGYDKPIVSTEQGGPDPRTLSSKDNTILKSLLKNMKEEYGKGAITRFLREHCDKINPKLRPFYCQDHPEQEGIYTKMQAADIVQRNVVMLASGVKATWWWNLISHGMDPVFGKMRLMTYEYERLPGYNVYKRMVSTLGPVSAVTRVDTGDASVYLYRIERSDEDTPLYVAWRREARADPYDAILAPAVDMTLPIELPDPQIIAATGEAVSYSGTTAVTVNLGGMPLFIVAPDADVSFAWRDVTPRQIIPLSNLPLLLE